MSQRLIKYNIFNKTKLVRATFYKENERLKNYEGDYDYVLWVERPEDMYALMSSNLRQKTVAVVIREDWLRGKEINA